MRELKQLVLQGQPEHPSQGSHQAVGGRVGDAVFAALLAESFRLATPKSFTRQPPKNRSSLVKCILPRLTDRCFLAMHSAT